jgi:5-formyltetrahydrofolate cyclo-ligase
VTKSDFRKGILSKTKKLTYSKRLLLSKKAINNLDRVLKKYAKKGDKILFFIPLKNEVDIIKYINNMRSRYFVFVPFMEDVSFEMVQYRLPLFIRRFNIKEPSVSSNFYKKDIDIMITPVVGVDKNYQRIGFGKGMYDRFFEKQLKRQRNAPKVIFLQLEKFFINKFICDEYDIKADVYITAKDSLEIKGKHGRNCRGNRSRESCRFFNLEKGK